MSIFNFIVLHFHEKIVEEHLSAISYTWARNLLQEAGLVVKKGSRKKHHKRRKRKPVRGMMLHIDGLEHWWFAEDGQLYDLIVMMDDVTSEICYAQLVDEDSTATCLEAIREVIEKHRVFCSLYSDCGSHFWTTPKEGGPVDKQALTQFGRALRELDIRMIAAYLPQARGASAPDRDAFRRNWGSETSPRLKRRTSFSRDAISVSSIESSLSMRQSPKLRPSCHAPDRTSTVSSRSRPNGPSDAKIR
ncbi:MAG TPA: hypothetical protein PKD24_04335 [Pyrinomonadaceae bacterium]|nr:hypothetical protein [Pyrinomonadaceae bacterium]HMP64778.1 hypothetical protein [Pyrinomonadaceae bacterium]